MSSRSREKLKTALAWEGSDLGVFIPEHLTDLKAEDDALQHAVVCYQTRVAYGATGILFLRKLSAPNTPYYTIYATKRKHGKYKIDECLGKQKTQPTPKILETLIQWANDTGNIDDRSIEDLREALGSL